MKPPRSTAVTGFSAVVKKDGRLVVEPWHVPLPADRRSSDPRTPPRWWAGYGETEREAIDNAYTARGEATSR